MLHKIGKWYSEGFLYKGSQGLSLTARIALLVAMFINVFMVIVRKLFAAAGWETGAGVVGAYEITEVSMVFIVTCAIAWTWYKAGHIRIGLFRDSLKGKPRAILDSFGVLLAMFFILITVWGVFYTAQLYLSMSNHTQLMHIPLAPFAFIFCAVMAHAFLVFLRSFIGLFSKAIGKKFAHEPYLEDQ